MPPINNPCPAGLRAYPNQSGCVALPITKGLATLREMQEFYNLEDAWDMLEIISINHYNERLWGKFHERG